MGIGLGGCARCSPLPSPPRARARGPCPSAVLNKVARLLPAGGSGRLRAPPRKSRESLRRLSLGSRCRLGRPCGTGVHHHGEEASSAVHRHPRRHRVPPQSLRQHRSRRRRRCHRGRVWPRFLCLGPGPREA
ncbi:NADH dehydrogenase [ubiquinone] 1 alpha subcomplex subunit 11 isoform X2 [Tupaia chinensis]|uniref:NADH dehydrogenase [ubiquinone] 1 alpha subcomplex subunit 11 isoform X2 n=1 Tax=Tupaia chinensis TaxID=246437 RepID=UPI000FFBBEA5|nr:NADH dehydrogenase [ubiquinone] 1 alpha subcomplex subunit 11 isoform X2 [Tupaia chinensis]